MLLNTKGAMFGLDARIALAIFGALSVISGAALYSAIQQSKVTAFIAQGQEVVKALEVYLLDVGNIPSSSTPGLPGYRQSGELVSSVFANWNGPYTSLERLGVDSLKTSSGITVNVMTLNGADWEHPIEWGQDTGDGCASGVGCYYWISFVGQKNEFAEAVDLMFDGVAGRFTGRVRLLYDSNDENSPVSNIIFQGPPVL